MDMADLEMLLKKLNDPHGSFFEKIDVINQLQKMGGHQALEHLRELLHHKDDYLRREAVQALGNVADPSIVEALVPMLDDRDGEVKKNAVVALGKLGGPAAEEGIRKALEDESMIVRYYAERALQDLAEKGGGSTPLSAGASLQLSSALTKLENTIASKPPKAPRPSIHEESHSSSRADAQVIAERPFSINEFMKSIAETTGFKMEKASMGYVLTVSLPDSRKQRVYVSFRQDDGAQTDLIVLYTTCGKAQPNLYKWALTANAKMAYGAIALRQIDGEDYFTISYTAIISAAQVEGMKKIILDLASKGDWIEKNLTKGQEDRF
jgi:hypothetical protein